jgi:hypothetical protein
MKRERIKSFLALNPGAIFIMLFSALIFTCAYLLITGYVGTPSIDSVAILAYCFLAVGVILQAAGFIRAKALEDRV